MAGWTDMWTKMLEGRSPYGAREDFQLEERKKTRHLKKNERRPIDGRLEQTDTFVYIVYVDTPSNEWIWLSQPHPLLTGV